jgi:hypothetical protein
MEKLNALGLITLVLLLRQAGGATDGKRGLVGHWKLQGDSSDYSGHGHLAKNHHVDLESGDASASEEPEVCMR